MTERRREEEEAAGRSCQSAFGSAGMFLTDCNCSSVSVTCLTAWSLRFVFVNVERYFRMLHVVDV